MFFWGPHCPRCKEARRLVGWHRGVTVTRHNTETAEGLSEAAFYAVLSTPSIIITEDGVVKAKFTSDTLPTRERIKELLK